MVPGIDGTVSALLKIGSTLAQSSVSFLIFMLFLWSVACNAMCLTEYILMLAVSMGK